MGIYRLSITLVGIVINSTGTSYCIFRRSLRRMPYYNMVAFMCLCDMAYLIIDLIYFFDLDLMLKCKLWQYIACVLSFCSQWILTLASIDRYFSVVSPLSYRKKWIYTKARWKILSVILVGCLSMVWVPVLIGPGTGRDNSTCDFVDGTSIYTQKGAIIFELLSTHVINFVLVLYCSIRLAYALMSNNHSFEMPKCAREDLGREGTHNRRESLIIVSKQQLKKEAIARCLSCAAVLSVAILDSICNIQNSVFRIVAMSMYHIPPTLTILSYSFYSSQYAFTALFFIILPQHKQMYRSLKGQIDQLTRQSSNVSSLTFERNPASRNPDANFLSPECSLEFPMTAMGIQTSQFRGRNRSII